MKPTTFREIGIGEFFRSGYQSANRDVLQRVPEGTHPNWSRANHINTRTGRYGSCGPAAPVLPTEPPAWPNYWLEAQEVTRRAIQDDRTYEFGVGGIAIDAADDVYQTTRQMLEAEKTIVTHWVILGRCEFCQGAFPRSLLMRASLGIACPDCYDRASDHF